ncbi:MAG: signal peptidase I [Galbitalea sp.]
MSNDQVAAAEPGGASSGGSRGHRGAWLFLRDILLILVAALVLSFVIKTFFVRSFYIPSASMVNTLEVNDRVIVSLLSPNLVPLQRGDIVVFEDPGGWHTGDKVRPQPQSPITGVLAFLGLAAPDDNNHLIKRVIGLPGDHVSCCSAAGQLTINGTPISEPYINLPPGVTRADPYPFSVTVPKGDLWVMGDNRDGSADSAYHDDKKDASPFVPISDVTGKALVISWPITRWTVLSNHPATFGSVKDPTTQ